MFNPIAGRISCRVRTFLARRWHSGWWKQPESMQAPRVLRTVGMSVAPGIAGSQIPDALLRRPSLRVQATRGSRIWIPDKRCKNHYYDREEDRQVSFHTDSDEVVE